MRYFSFLIIIMFFIQSISPSFSGIEDEIDSTFELMHQWRKAESARQPSFESHTKVSKKLKESVTGVFPFQFVKDVFERTRKKYGVYSGSFVGWVKNGFLNFPQRMQQSFLAHAQEYNPQTLDGENTLTLAEDFDADPKKLIAHWYKNSGTRKVETAVVAVGMTGSGKSTTIAGLMGARLRKTPEGEIELDPSEDPKKYPKIGLDGTSQTSYPEFFESKIAKVVFVDCPGLNDNRGPIYNMVRDATLECTIKSIDHPKLLVVIGHDELTAVRGEPFMKFVSHFAPAFQPTVHDSILWVVTKTPNKGTQQDVLKKMQKVEKSVSWRLFLKGKLARAVHLEGTTIDQQELKKEIEDLEEAKAILKSINENNLLLFDPLNVGSRDKVLTRFGKLPSTPASEFRFKSENQSQFRKFSEDVIREGFSFGYRRNEHRILSNNFESNIRFIEKELAQVATGGKQLKEIIKQKIVENDQHLRDLENERAQIKAESQKFHADGHEVCVYEKSVDEKRRYGSLNWTVQHFQYTGSPIKEPKKEPHDPNGKFTHWAWENKDGQGSFYAKYVGGWGKDAFAHVKLFGAFNQQPHIGILLESLDEKERFLERSIIGIKDELVLLNQTFVNPEQLTTPQLQTERDKLTAQKLTEEQKFASIRQQIQEKADLFKGVDYMRGRLLLRNELDPSFQNFLLDTL